jgi:hypothetical protein
VRLGGTDADLRKLTTEDCVRWLTPHGYTHEQVRARVRLRLRARARGKQKTEGRK